MTFYALGIWLGIGIGLVIADVLENGQPSDWRRVVDYILCPLLWPIAVWRRLRG